VELFETRAYLPGSLPGIDYDTARDGRFLMIKRRPQEGESAATPKLTFVTHWTDELRARVK